MNYRGSIKTVVEIVKGKLLMLSSLVNSDLTDLDVLKDCNPGGANFEYLFSYKHDTYLYDKGSNSYTRLEFDVSKNFSELRTKADGLTEGDHQTLK